MITLKTLHSATLQEIFDQAAKHLLLQNKQAMLIDSTGQKNCLYRGAGSTKCAVGCFIADDEYSLQLENTAFLVLARVLQPLNTYTNEYVNTFNAKNIAVEKNWYGAGLDEQQYKLLAALQTMHDEYEPDGMYKPPQYIFENDLAEIASRFDLIYDRSRYV